MKVAPVSADLLVKLALGAAAIGAAWWVVHKVQGVTGNVLDATADGIRAAAKAINPTSNENFAYRGFNVLTGGDFSTDAPPLGARIFEWFNGDENERTTPGYVPHEVWRAPDLGITDDGHAYDPLGNRIY